MRHLFEDTRAEMRRRIMENNRKIDNAMVTLNRYKPGGKNHQDALVRIADARGRIVAYEQALDMLIDLETEIVVA